MLREAVARLSLPADPDGREALIVGDVVFVLGRLPAGPGDAPYASVLADDAVAIAVAGEREVACCVLPLARAEEVSAWLAGLVARARKAAGGPPSVANSEGA